MMLWQFGRSVSVSFLLNIADALLFFLEEANETKQKQQEQQQEQQQQQQH